MQLPSNHSEGLVIRYFVHLLQSADRTLFSPYSVSRPGMPMPARSLPGIVVESLAGCRLPKLAHSVKCQDCLLLLSLPSFRGTGGCLKGVRAGYGRSKKTKGGEKSRSPKKK